jgi:hypothetical protein
MGWWELMMKAGQKVEPGMRPPAPIEIQPLPPRSLGILLCMRHRKRASECGCLAGGY